MKNQAVYIVHIKIFAIWILSKIKLNFKLTSKSKKKISEVLYKYLQLKKGKYANFTN